MSSAGCVAPCGDAWRAPRSPSSAAVWSEALVPRLPDPGDAVLEVVGPAVLLGGQASSSPWTSSCMKRPGRCVERHPLCHEADIEQGPQGVRLPHARRLTVGLDAVAELVREPERLGRGLSCLQSSIPSMLSAIRSVGSCDPLREVPPVGSPRSARLEPKGSVPSERGG